MFMYYQNTLKILSLQYVVMFAVYVAVSHNKVLSALKDIWAHVGSVADWGRGKKRELGCNNPHVDHEAFCRGIEALMSHTAQPCPLGARNPVKRSVNVCAQDSVGHLPYSKVDLRRRAVSSI